MGKLIIILLTLLAGISLIWISPRLKTDPNYEAQQKREYEIMRCNEAPVRNLSLRELRDCEKRLNEAQDLRLKL